MYVDGTEDHILIKEFTRGTTSVGAFTTAEVNHALGYFPTVFVTAQISTGLYQTVYGLTTFSDYHTYVDSTKLYLRNSSASSKTFAYYILYDNL